jgi:hypothetical protein
MANKFTYVVLGPGYIDNAGMIKQVVLAENIASPLVDYKDSIARISTAEVKKGTGTMFLEDMYIEEGKRAHYEAFVAHREAIREGRPVRPFPDSLLPAKVREWVQNRGKASQEFDPVAFVEEKTAAPKAGKAEAPKPAGEKTAAPKA